MNPTETNPTFTKADLLKEIDNTKEVLKTREQFERLINSQDFKDVILNGFCIKDASQYNLMLNDPFTNDTLHKQSKLLLDTAAGINIWIAAKRHMYENAETSLKEAQEALGELGE